MEKAPNKVLPTPSSPQKLDPGVIVKPVVSALGPPLPAPAEEGMTCERCGAEMYRMHAVWRCPACRFKTDCCGW